MHLGKTRVFLGVMYSDYAFKLFLCAASVDPHIPKNGIVAESTER